MIAQVAIRDVVNGHQMEEWFNRPKGEFPVLRLSDEAAQAIGARHRVAVMNPGILHKQKREHKDMELSHYRLLPELGEHPAVIVKQKPKDDKGERVAVIRAGEQVYMAVVRAEQDGQNTLVVSFRRSRDSDIRRLIRDGTVLYGKWDAK